jgi:chromate transporter
MAIAPCFERLRTSAYFNKSVSGILCCFAGLLITVTGQFASGVQWNIPGIIIFCASFVALLLKADILWVVLIGATLSIFL